MSSELRQLLEDAAHEPTDLPTTEQTWSAGRRRRRLRRAVTAATSVVAVAALVLGTSALLDDRGRGPEILDRPTTPASPEPDPTPSGSEAPSPDLPPLSELAVASTVSLDDGATYESRYPDGTVVRAVADGVAYPEQLYGLADGTVVWRSQAGVRVLGPDSETATTLVAAPEDAAGRLELVGTGELDGEPVVLVWEGRAASPQDDEGGALSAYRLDGSRQVLVELASAWESGVFAASLVDGWLLYGVGGEGQGSLALRSPEGTTTAVEGAYAEGGTLQHAALAQIDVAPGIAIVEHHVEHGDPDAPFGAGRLEIRSVEDPRAPEPVRVISLPTDNVPKHLTVAREHAYLTLLPDAPELLQVDLHRGEVERFSAPGIVALHADLQPRPADAPPPAPCADLGGITTGDAQPYVWLPCWEAGTFEEGDPPAEFWGIHKRRLVTDPRASEGGVAQRTEAMLEAIFAGPTEEERELGYTGIIDPDLEALDGVTFVDGLLTVHMTEAGARSASIGTAARASFLATVEAAVFNGFVDVQRLRLTVEGDCVLWSGYGEGPIECPTYHRDGSVTWS